MPAKTPKKKQTYGCCNIDHFRPKPDGNWPKAINITLSFEDAMKLHLSLQHILLDINGLNRATREGKAAAVNLCAYVEKQRITVNKDKLRPNKS